MRKRCEEAGVKLKKSEGVGAEFIEKIQKSQEAAGMLVKEQKRLKPLRKIKKPPAAPLALPFA